MKFLNMLAAGWIDIFTKPSDYTGTENYEWMGQIFNAISIVLYIIMGIVGAAGAIYAIYLGVQLARAEEQGKRDDAKKHLVTVLIAVGVTIALVLFFNLLLPEIVKAFLGGNIYTPNKK